MNRFLAAAFLLLGGLAVPARADFVDQSQLSETVPMTGFYQTGLAQSFEQSASNISGASIGLYAGFGDGLAGNITIALYNNLPTSGGTLLASGTANGILAGQFATVHWTPVTVVPNSTLYLVFTSTDTTLAVGGDTTNPYSRGQVYANAGYGSFPTYDYTFQTFASSAAVPEPASLTLMGLGLAGVAAVGLRRRNRDRLPTT